MYLHIEQGKFFDMAIKMISFEEIVASNEQFSSISEKEFQKIMDAFDKEQPALAEFLWNEFAEELSDETLEFLYFVGLQIWYIYSQFNKNVPVISEDTIKAAFNKNEEMLDYIHGIENEADFAAFFEQMIENHTQKHLCSYALSLAYDYGKETEEEPEDEDNPFLQMPVYEEEMDIEEYESIARDIALVAFKTVLDVFSV